MRTSPVSWDLGLWMRLFEDKLWASLALETGDKGTEQHLQLHAPDFSETHLLSKCQDLRTQGFS